MAPSASSNRPLRWLVDPVKAPFSWPNSSLSASAGGSAAQFTLISGRSFLGPSAWIASATSSVPVSPRMRTVVSEGATCRMRKCRYFIGSLCPSNSPDPSTDWIFSR